MKNIGISFLLGLAALLSGCYKDDSTSNYMLVNPINIVDEGPSARSVYSLETLNINPIVYKEGRDDTSLSFQWTLYHQNIVPTLLGDQMTLSVPMNFQAMGAPYKLLYRVTDNETGLFVEKSYDITIMSPFSTGLIVCDSHDGATSDVSLAMHKNFLYGYTRDTVMRDLFSKINGRKVPGIVTGAVSTYYQSFATLTISTPEAIERVDPRDYSFVDNNGDMFYYDPGVYNVKALLNDANSGYDIMNNDGKIYMRSFQQANRLYGYHFMMPDKSETNITKVHKPYWNSAVCFDDLNGRFLGLDNSNNRFLVFQPAANDYFPYTGHGDYECLQIFDGYNNRTLAVMKHRTTGRIRVLSFGNDTSTYPYRLFTQWIFDLDPAICPEIDKARFFCSTETTPTIYYATDKTIYGVSILVPSSLVTNVEYTAPAGEEITCLYPWTNYRAGGMVDYTNPDPNAANRVLEAYSQNRMLVISTYGAASREGFVNTVAISNVQMGTLEKNRDLHKRFGGFGRISITTFQEK